MGMCATRLAFNSAKVFFVAFFLALFLFEGVRMALFTSPGDRIAHFHMRYWAVVVSLSSRCKSRRREFTFTCGTGRWW